MIIVIILIIIIITFVNIVIDIIIIIVLLYQVNRVALTEICDHARMNAMFSYRDQLTSGKIL